MHQAYCCMTTTLKLEVADTSQSKLMVKALVQKTLWCCIGGKLKCKAQLYQLW